ncbi:MAG: glycosyltransferase, partial [Patescibacteria group bacterium]
GRVNAWAAKFATKIAVSFQETTIFFSVKIVSHTGQPIRKELMEPLHEGAYQFLKLSGDVPTILILGGSTGAQIINDTLVDALPELVKNYQIIHQTGKINFKDVVARTNTMLVNNPYKNRYRAFEYLDPLAMRMSVGIANLIISRAGSAIFEIAVWGIPSIIIPITDSQGDHQRKNAYSYARTTACVVLDEANLTPNILISEATRLLSNPAQLEVMKKAALGFGNRNAARAIAKEILAIALRHEI